MYYKAVYSYIDKERQEHRSITISPFSLIYVPGEWTRPVLPGSRIFVYDSIRNALMMHKYVPMEYIPFHGVTFWMVHVINPVRIDAIKDPPAALMDRFWKMRAKGVYPSTDYNNEVFPFVYKFRDRPSIFGAERVRLIEMVPPEDLEGYQLSQLTV